MTVKQIQKIEEIVETLDRLKTYINKETAHIQDIMDMGLNELSIPNDVE